MEDWCISRQRFWGVPIPAFYHRDTGRALMTVDTIDALLARMEATKSGVVVWWSSSVAELLPPAMASEAHLWVRGTDTMDVWMDSGLSWSHMVERGVPAPFDMVLEGTDQYRGWFQSSLLTWLAAGNKGAPWKAVVVHGFCLDSNGVKMSKSVGNVIPPSALTHGCASTPGEPLGFEANGVDVMRLWVASHDFSKEISAGRVAVDAVANHYKKMRNTIRWILGCLADYHPSAAAASSSEGYLAQHLLSAVAEVQAANLADFHQLDFASVVKRMSQFVAMFSGLHVEAMKDSLYCDPADSPLRRANQHALFEALKLFVCSLQPMLPHTVVDVLSNTPPQLGLSQAALLPWSCMASTTAPAKPPRGWAALSALRDETNRLLEALRNDKLIGSPLEAALELTFPAGGLVAADFYALGDRERPCFFGTVSSVAVMWPFGTASKYQSSLTLHGEDVLVSLLPFPHPACPRCKMRGPFNSHAENLCGRCAAVMGQ